MFDEKLEPAARVADTWWVLTYEKYVERERGELNYKKWKEKPHCACCGKPVIPYKGKSDQKFTTLTKGVTGRYDGVGFVHLKRNDLENCAFSFSEKVQFLFHIRQMFESKRRADVAAALNKIRPENEKVLNYLFSQLAGRDMKGSEKEKFQKIEKMLHSMPAFADHPYMMPFFLILCQNPVKRISLKNKEYKQMFRWSGRQKHEYIDTNGHIYRGFFAPGAIQVCLVFGPAGQVKYVPKKDRPTMRTRFEISKESWLSIVSPENYPPPPPLPHSIPSKSRLPKANRNIPEIPKQPSLFEVSGKTLVEHKTPRRPKKAAVPKARPHANPRLL